MNLIKGYMDSDGCIMEKENKCHSSFISISLDLLEGIQDILFSIGVFSNLCILRKAGHKYINTKYCKTKETYNLRLGNYDSILLADKIGYKLTNNIISDKNRNKRYGYFSPDENYIYFRIKDINKYNYKGDVYNYQTNSSNFMCRNVPTHNCDVSKGTGEHYSTIQVLRIDSIRPVKTEQVAVYESNQVDPYRFSEIVNRVAIYYNDAHIMAENNAEGSTVVSELHWSYENEGLVNSGNKINSLGVRATTKTKPRAVILMKKLIEGDFIKLNDKGTIKQLTDFVEKGNNRFKCDNLNDDLVSGLY
ncbi:MAG: LAGLIDADG family homing endonuclease [Halanaerobiales bacterium]